VLTRRDAIHHLLRLGLLTPEDVVSRPIAAAEYVGRNHLVRVETPFAPSYVVKQPRDPSAPDAMTMWTEAAVFWLSANEPAFAPLVRWMPKYYHYDERNAILTIELVQPADSLMAKLSAGGSVPPAMLHDVGRAFGVLHGSVSTILRDERTRRLFRTGPAWAMTLGSSHQHYVPATNAARAILAHIVQRPDALAAFERARATWRDEHVIHGDAKAANILVLEDGSVRVIDWEIAALGDGLWDLGGLVQSLLVPNPMEPVQSLAAAQQRARPLLDALWSGYVAALPEPPPGDDPRVTMLRLAGVRMVQTCLESAQFTEQVHPTIPGVLAMGLELVTQPEASRERWERAA
jgi:Phosphotransferase enzyme family